MEERGRVESSSSPIVGNGFATFQYGEHVDNLKDTHNWYVKVMVETGIIGLIIAFFLLQQMLAVSYPSLQDAQPIRSIKALVSAFFLRSVPVSSPISLATVDLS